MRGGKTPAPDIKGIVDEYREIMKDAGIGWFDESDNQSVKRQPNNRVEYLEDVYRTAIRSLLVRDNQAISVQLVETTGKQRGGNLDDLVSPPQSDQSDQSDQDDFGDIPSDIFLLPDDTPPPPRKKTPILAISNFAAFVEETKPEDVQQNMASLLQLQQAIRKEAGLQTSEKLHVMLVVTAALHRTGGRRSRSRIEGLRAIPWTLLLQMRNLFGDDIVIHVTHFMDPVLEAISDVTVLGHEAETQAFGSPGVFMEAYFENQMVFLNEGIINARLTNSTYNNIAFGVPYVFDVTSEDQEETSKKLGKALHSVNAMYCVGGETHWLNRQFKKVGMKDTLKTVLQNHTIVCCGNSAGLINMGMTTSFVASKLLFGVWTNDDTSDLANAEGDRILIPLPTHARTGRNQSPEPIDYSGLEVRKIAFFPHYDKEWNETIDGCVKFHKDSDGDLEPLSHSNVVRLTDGMIIWFGSEETWHLFADPNWQSFFSNKDAFDDDILDDIMGFDRKPWNTAAALRANDVAMTDTSAATGNDDIVKNFPIKQTSSMEFSIVFNRLQEQRRLHDEQRRLHDEQRRLHDEQRRPQEEQQRQDEQRRRQEERRQSGGGVYAANVAAVGVLALATVASAFIR